MAQKANEMGTLYFSRQFFIRTPPVEVEDYVPQDLLEEKNLSYYF